MSKPLVMFLSFLAVWVFALTRRRVDVEDTLKERQ